MTLILFTSKIQQLFISNIHWWKPDPVRFAEIHPFSSRAIHINFTQAIGKLLIIAVNLDLVNRILVAGMNDFNIDFHYVVVNFDN